MKSNKIRAGSFMKIKKLLILSDKLASMGLNEGAKAVRLLSGARVMADNEKKEQASTSNLLNSAMPSAPLPDSSINNDSEPSSAQVGGGLSPGDKGDAVKDMQEKLIEKGYAVSYSGSGGADGDYGKNTENGVVYFQVLNEIHPPNGIADSRVISKINSGDFIGPNDTKEPHPEAEKIEYTEKDLDAMARGIIVETGFRASYREMAGILWIMINRSKKWNMPLYKVIDPNTGGGKNWFGKLSDSNKKRWKRAHIDHPNFEYIKSFVKKILDGTSFQNEIGSKAHFLHPGGMPKCSGNPGSSCGKKNRRICVDTGKWGKRCLPKWNIDGNTNMTGDVAVRTIGKARFS